MKFETLDAQLDLAMAAVKKAGKKRAQVHIDQIDTITLMTVTIGTKISRQYFEHNVRAYPYWLEREKRMPIVKHFWHEGLTQVRIAEILGVATSTVARDMRMLRDNNEIDVEKRTTKADIVQELKLQPTKAGRKPVKQQHDLRDFAFGQAAMH